MKVSRNSNVLADREALLYTQPHSSIYIKVVFFPLITYFVGQKPFKLPPDFFQSGGN